MSKLFEQPVNLTPEQFEEEVEKLLRKLGVDLAEFKVQRLEKLDAADGVYEIDVTARFEALGASFLVLIECKHHKARSSAKWYKSSSTDCAPSAGTKE
jgi:restriction system protein